MKPPKAPGGIMMWPWSAQLGPEDVTVKKFISDGDKEAPTNCRGCGYNTTDEERAYYGVYLYDDEKSTKRHRHIIKQLHYCTFCVESALHKKRLFGGLNYKIHCAKVRLRNKILDDSFIYLLTCRQTLLDAHYDDIHNAPYKEENGVRIYNEHELEFNSFTKSINEYRAAPRHLYLEALEEFGGASDEPPCTRNLNKKQKRRLLKKLKNL